MQPENDADMQREVAIRLLGAFSVVVDGHPVPDSDWRGRRPVELVQLLAMSARRSLPRERAIEALWPHLEAKAGAANLRKAAHLARRALGDPHGVVLAGGRVSLFPSGTVTTDLDDFEKRAEAALASGGAEECAAAAAICGGELLPAASPDRPWIALARDRVTARYLALLRASSQWARIVEIEPANESAYRELMRAALARGDRALAIQWYGRLREVLGRRLGVLPSEETERVYDECVEGLETAVPGLVGRHVEIARVTDVLRKGPSDRPTTVLVRGPAGIGKSRLCEEIGRLAEQERWCVVPVVAWGADRPYAPWIEVIESLVRSRPELLDSLLAGSRATLAALTDAVAPTTALEGPPTRHRVVGALRRLLVAAGEGDPVLIVFDDADRADEASIETALQLAVSGRPLTVVLACRSETAKETLSEGIVRLSRVGRISRIDLGPLDRAEAEDLVAQAAAGPLEPGLAEEIVRLGEGNPFVTVELARSADPRAPDRLPPNAGEAIASRLVDLDPDVVERLERMALVSEDLGTDGAACLTGGTEEEAFEVLDRALEAGVLVTSGSRYRFRHDLVRQALVDRVPHHRRLAVHRDAARRLSALGARPALVAFHWLAGERPEEAVDSLVAAAREAMDVGAYRDALGHLASLLAHDAAHGEALRMKAEALDMLGDPEALPAYDAAIRVVGEPESHDLRAMRALAQIKQGDPAGALEAIAGVEPVSVLGRLSEALTYSGAAALGYADPALGTAKAAESRRLALEAGDTGAIVVASWAQAAAAHARGELGDSVLADLRDTSKLPHLAVRVFDGQLCITQRFLYGARPYPEVIAFADGLAAEAQRLGALRGQAFGLTLRGQAELLSGCFDEAARDLEQAREMHRETGGATGEALVLQRLAQLHMWRGDRREAAALLAEALSMARETDVGFHLFDRIYGTRVALAADPEEALEAAVDAEAAVTGPQETCPGCRITLAVPAAIAYAKGGDLDKAYEYERTVDWLADVVMRLPAWHAAREEVRGHVARAEGDVERARTSFGAASLGFGRAGHPIDRARCLELAAEVR